MENTCISCTVVTVLFKIYLYYRINKLLRYQSHFIIGRRRVSRILTSNFNALFKNMLSAVLL